MRACGLIARQSWRGCPGSASQLLGRHGAQPVLEILLHKGPLPVNTIGRRIMLTSGSITTAIDRLEEKRYVHRQRCPKDRRVTFVQLTATGRRLIQRSFKVHSAELEKAFEPLSATERTALETLLKKIGKHSEVLAQSGTEKIV